MRFFFSGSDAETVKGMREGRYHIGLDPKPFLLCGAKANGAGLFNVRLDAKECNSYDPKETR